MKAIHSRQQPKTTSESDSGKLKAKQATAANISEASERSTLQAKSKSKRKRLRIPKESRKGEKSQTFYQCEEHRRVKWELELGWNAGQYLVFYKQIAQHSLVSASINKNTESSEVMLVPFCARGQHSHTTLRITLQRVNAIDCERNKNKHWRQCQRHIFDSLIDRALSICLYNRSNIHARSRIGTTWWASAGAPSWGCTD
jgi:hypothetical protein